MRLNVGCGRMVLDGWVNVDVQASPKAPRPPDYLADIRSLPFEDRSADVLMAIHVVEHFYRWEVQSLLIEWWRVLKDGGILILELPNLEAACRNVLENKGDQMGMWPLYGDPSHKDPYMCHRWGWTPATLTKELEAVGFRKIKSAPTEYHGKRHDRDMRLEAVK